MLLRAEQIERILHSRNLSVAAFVLMLVMGYVSQLFHPGDAVMSLEGTAAQFSVGKGSVTAAYLAGVVCISAIAMFISLLHKHFLFITALTSFYTTFLFCFSTAIPALCGEVGHMLPAIVSLGCSMILFSCYEDRTSMSRVFMIFTILSAFTLVEYAFIAYIALFVVGVIQMRIFSLRTFLAILFGIITPYWIVLGFGIVSPLDLTFPHPESAVGHIWSENNHFVLEAVLLIGIVTPIANSFNLLKLKLQLRAYNGFFIMQFTASTAMIFIDYSRYLDYAMTPIVCTAVFLAQYFTMSGLRRKYIVMLAGLLAAIAASIIGIIR